MKYMKRLAKRGWWKAMIHQRTLSLILTLDDFLISGPHLCSTYNNVTLSDPNIFVIKDNGAKITEDEESNTKNQMEVSTYYVIRPHIRGILYGLNPLYQISLYVPCTDKTKMTLYRDIISRIDIGGQFFHDRIYWTFDALKKDIMDSKLACLIYAGNFCLVNDWLRKIGVESKYFSATIDANLTMTDSLFDLVEMRSFLEDVHQRYFSLLSESDRFYFSNMMRLQVNEKSNKDCTQSAKVNPSGFLSVTNSQLNNKAAKTFMSEGYSVNAKEVKKKMDFMFKTSNDSPLTWKTVNADMLLEEYEDIIQEQLEINHDINLASPMKSSFAKTLCRWNTITQRKSDVLKMLMSYDDKEHIHERLRQLNSVYSMKRFQSESDLFGSEQSVQSSQSTTSGNSNDLGLSNKFESENHNENIPQFTTWYIKQIKL